MVPAIKRRKESDSKILSKIPKLIPIRSAARRQSLTATRDDCPESEEASTDRDLTAAVTCEDGAVSDYDKNNNDVMKSAVKKCYKGNFGATSPKKRIDETNEDSCTQVSESDCSSDRCDHVDNRSVPVTANADADTDAATAEVDLHHADEENSINSSAVLEKTSAVALKRNRPFLLITLVDNVDIVSVYCHDFKLRKAASDEQSVAGNGNGDCDGDDAKKSKPISPIRLTKSKDGSWHSAEVKSVREIGIGVEPDLILQSDSYESHLTHVKKLLADGCGTEAISKKAPIDQLQLLHKCLANYPLRDPFLVPKQRLHKLLTAPYDEFLKLSVANPEKYFQNRRSDDSYQLSFNFDADNYLLTFGDFERLIKTVDQSLKQIDDNVNQLFVKKKRPLKEDEIDLERTELFNKLTLMKYMNNATNQHLNNNNISHNNFNYCNGTGSESGKSACAALKTSTTTSENMKKKTSVKGNGVNNGTLNGYSLSHSRPMLPPLHLAGTLPFGMWPESHKRPCYDPLRNSFANISDQLLKKLFYNNGASGADHSANEQQLHLSSHQQQQQQQLRNDYRKNAPILNLSRSHNRPLAAYEPPFRQNCASANCYDFIS